MNLLPLFETSDDIQEMAAGRVVFTQGEPGDVMYVVLEGNLGISAGGQDVSEIGPGDICGEMALIDSSPRSATITTKSDVKLATVDRKNFARLVQDSPYFALHVMTVLAERLRKQLPGS